MANGKEEGEEAATEVAVKKGGGAECLFNLQYTHCSYFHIYNKHDSAATSGNEQSSYSARLE